MTAERPTQGRFFSDPGFDFEARAVLGHTPLGALSAGLTLKACERIVDGDADSWFASWNGVARLLHDHATSSLAAGRSDTASAFFIGASDAYARSIVFADRMADTSRQDEAFEDQRACWESFIAQSGERFVRLTVPAGEATLPVYLLRADATGSARPTLVLTGGGASMSSVFASGAGAALSRGWNAVVYEGPGQGTVLADQGVPTRHDWEVVLAPILDELVRRGDVDDSEVFAYGIGEGAYSVARTLAFEHRFAGAVLDPGVMDISTAWTAHLPPEIMSLFRSGNAAAFDAALEEIDLPAEAIGELAVRSRALGLPFGFDAVKAATKFHLREIAGRIPTPLLITIADGEQIWPGQSEELYNQVSGHRELAMFTASIGAEGHGEPLGREIVELRMLDFLQSRVDEVRTSSTNRDIPHARTSR